MFIRGLFKDITEDTLLNYFENTRRSGGGPVEEVKISENTAHVKFESCPGGMSTFRLYFRALFGTFFLKVFLE